MRRKLGRVIVSIILAVVVFLSTAIPVLAIAPPDTAATIDAIDVYRSCVETNDQLYVIQYTITYAATPTETIDQAYIFRLMNGATELKSATAYAYHTKGYGKGIAAIYFSATEVTAKAMGWVGAYTVVISGNPTLSWTGSGCPYVTSTTYDTWNDPMGTVLGTDILVLAQTFTVSWAYTATPLYISSGGTMTLSSLGENYFGISIPNLMTMQPSIFSSSIAAAQYHERTNPLTYATSIGHTYWAGTWVDNAIQPTASALNISDTVIYAGIWTLVTLTLLGLMIWKTGLKFEILLLVGGAMTLFGSLLHFYPMLIPISIGVILTIIFVWKIFWQPSGA